MVAIQSVGTLQEVSLGWTPQASYASVQLYDSYYYDYATLYRVQPNVRTCVDFLARNIAQLGLHWFRRMGETDRQRLRDHPIARLLDQPLPPWAKVTRYKLIESLMGDLGIYWNAYWLKMRRGSSAEPVGLLRLPPPYVTVEGGFVPRLYQVNAGGKRWDLAPDQVVHFRGYNPENALQGLSPLETLRRVLAEEHAAGDYRENFWANAARISGIIERPSPPTAPEWTEAAMRRFQASFEEAYAGSANSGRTPVLEDGMTWKEASFNAQESEYLAGRKLTREECARAYHIPLPMVGILDNATFSNIKEQHKHLYQDCLGPWLAMLEQDTELQLLSDYADREGVYCEFNIAEKLQGSFDEQATAFQAAVGAPYMTRNEARARQNLPSVEGGDELVTPLNVLVGGQASPRDSAPEGRARKGGDPSPPPLSPSTGRGEITAPSPLPSPESTRVYPRVQGEGGRAAGTAALPAGGVKAAEVDPTLATVRGRHEEKWREVLARFFRRQENAIIARVPASGPAVGVWSDLARWVRELHQDMFRLNVATATVWAQFVAKQMDLLAFDDSAMLEYLDENARIASEEINATTVQQVTAALTADEDVRGAVRHVFEVAVGARAAEIATAKVTNAASFGSQEAARQGGGRSTRH